MSNGEIRKLPVLDIARNAYAAFRDNLKLHVLLSYIFFVPLGLLMLLPGMNPIQVASQADGNVAIHITSFYIGFMVISFIVVSTLTLVFYRLYLFGPEEYLKIALSTLGRMLVKYILYILAMAGLLVIFILMMLVFLGLVQLFIHMLTGQGTAQPNTAFGYVYALIIFGMVAGISFRLQSTLVSVAENRHFLPFKAAWFYSRGNTVPIFLAMLLCTVPAWVLSTLVSQGVIMALGVKHASDIGILYALLQFVLSPLLYAPLSLSSACMVQVYRHLVLPSDITGQHADFSV